MNSTTPSQINSVVRFLSLSALLLLFVSSSRAGVIYNGTLNAPGDQFNYSLSNSTLTLSNNSTSITGVWNRTVGQSGNNYFVMYLDTESGGHSSTSALTSDSFNSYTASVTALGTVTSDRTNVTFASGFEADYAIAFAPSSTSDSAFKLQSDGSLFYQGEAARANMGDNFTFDINFSQLGLPDYTGTPFSFNFVVTYFDPNYAYRSGEGMGGNVGFAFPLGSSSFSSFATYTVVPEPSSLAYLAAFAVIAVCVATRRNRRTV
ncbi:MAG: hypothetical protein WCH43_04885 [Verrucomicrobiota bacterium]